MNFTNSDLSSSQDDLDLPLKDEYPNSPPTNCNNFCALSTLDRDSSDTFISCSPPDTPSKCLNSSPAPNQSPCSHVMSDSPALPIPSSPEQLSWPEHQPCDYEVESCEQERHSPPLPPPPPYPYSISQNKIESPTSLSAHPVTRRLSPSPAELHCPSVSLIPEPLPLTEKTPLLSGDRPNEELHQLSCPHPLPSSHSSSINTPQINNPSSSQFMDESFTLRLSPSYREPFYSLSPKSELYSESKPSSVVPSSSPSLSPLLDLISRVEDSQAPVVPSSSSSTLSNFVNEVENSLNAAGTSRASVAASCEDAPMIEEVKENKDAKLLKFDHETETKPSTSSFSNKVLPEPVPEPPCIVDLTGDDDSPDGDGDDDEVEIVSADQPVVFLKTETVSSSSSSGTSSRRNRKRKRHESPRVVEETIIIHEDPPAVLSEGPSSSTPTTTAVINVADSPEGSGPDEANPAISSSSIPNSYSSRNNNNSNNNNTTSFSSSSTTGIFEMTDASRVFGDLLNSPVIPLDNHNSSSMSSQMYCSCSSSSTTNDGINPIARICGFHQHARAVNILPHMSIPRCGSGEERRQSSINPQPVMVTPSQSLDAPIPQDVLNDIESLLNDNVRNTTSYIRNFFIQPSVSGASGSSADFVMSSGPRTGLLSRHTLRIPSPVEADLRSPASTAGFQPSTPQESTSCARTSSTAVNSVSSSSSINSSSTDFGDDSGGLSCPICFESFQDIKTAGRSLSSTVCGHIFCTACLEASLKQAKQCPTCRKRLRKKQYHPLYI